jgi:hypothetical protein
MATGIACNDFSFEEGKSFFFGAALKYEFISRRKKFILRFSLLLLFILYLF